MGGDISYRAMSSVPVTAMWIPAIVQCGGIHVPTTVLCGGYTCTNDCAMWGYQQLCYMGIPTTTTAMWGVGTHCQSSVRLFLLSSLSHLHLDTSPLLFITHTTCLKLSTSERKGGASQSQAS